MLAAAASEQHSHTQFFHDVSVSTETAPASNGGGDFLGTRNA
jgi:hypothetical protein